MRAVDIIRRKRDGETLDAAAIQHFVAGATDGTWSDYQLSAMLMAVVLRGMSETETAALTDAMTRSGAVLPVADLPGRRVDKHSTGGVGDKVSLALAPIVAACGGLVPMMSGRGLGHTGGTLDKLETIPGFRTGLEPADVRRILADVGCCIFSQSDTIAPADRTLYALRDVTATVESVALITASIVSKKLAEGLDALVFDVKVGRGAFMKSLDEARALAASLVGASTRNGVASEALITRMDVPLGRAVGNALEVEEAVEVLNGGGPTDLLALVQAFAVAMLVRGGLASGRDEAGRLVLKAIESGAARERFVRMVEAQGGDARVVDDPGRLPRVADVELVRAGATGFVHDVDAMRVARAAMALGAGRERADSPIDPAVGIRMTVRPGEPVAAGDGVLELHHRNGRGLSEARALLSDAVVIDDRMPAPLPLIVCEVR